jgi:hypothetical protein
LPGFRRAGIGECGDGCGFPYGARYLAQHLRIALLRALAFLPAEHGVGGCEEADA